ncbi:MAG TPA: hypothetical protein VM100_12515 [Longimicrobiales bacterium]|nr:hypothetical protein [Longimicrobiales bacterium]
MTRGALHWLILSATLIAACDQAPTGLPANLSESSAYKNTLPALFREAIDKTNAEQGAEGVDILLAEWRSKDKQLKKRAPGASRAEIQNDLDALHGAELRVVLSSLGGGVITRALSDIKVSLAQSEALMESARLGGMAPAGANIINQVREKVRLAEAAAHHGKLVDALDIATQGSTILSGLDYYLVEVRRIGGIEALYPKAVEAARSGDDDSAATLLRATEAANDAARVALRSGDRQAALQKLEAARKGQIELVLHTLGPSAANALVREADDRTRALRDSLTTMRKNGDDVLRFERMLREATDLARRARIAADANDYQSAIDLGSHAAGLLNALQHLIRK